MTSLRDGTGMMVNRVIYPEMALLLHFNPDMNIKMKIRERQFLNANIIYESSIHRDDGFGFAQKWGNYCNYCK